MAETGKTDHNNNYGISLIIIIVNNYLKSKFLWPWHVCTNT